MAVGLFALLVRSRHTLNHTTQSGKPTERSFDQLEIMYTILPIVYRNTMAYLGTVTLKVFFILFSCCSRICHKRPWAQSKLSPNIEIFLAGSRFSFIWIFNNGSFPIFNWIYQIAGLKFSYTRMALTLYSISKSSKL